MKEKIVNYSMVILVLTVSFGLFQAWEKSKKPFAFYSKNENIIEKSKYMSNQPTKVKTNRNYVVQIRFGK
ncbi:MAG: hypothetical protein Q8904_01685 [Bacteroidota bacterium]|nr:hypothetical protein [Bacteroidota bacterium]